MKRADNRFSYARFAAYFKMLWVERWRSNTLKMALVLGISLVLMIWISFLLYPDAVDSTYYANRDIAEEPLFIVMSLLFLLSGCVAGNDMLKGARSKGERITMLTMPVTTFEKWLARWSMCVPLYVIAFLLCLYLADTARVLLFSYLFPTVKVYYLNPFDFDLGDGNIRFLWLAYFYITGIYVLGSVFFPRKSLLKTTTFAFILFVLVALIQVSFSFLQRETLSNAGGILMEIFLWISIPIIWYLSYWRLKELEVIDRM